MATKGRYIYYHCLFPAVLFVCLSFQILKHRKIWQLYHMLCLTGITFRFSLWEVGGRPWDGEKDKFDEEVQNPAGEIELYWLHNSRIPFPLADYVSFFSTEDFFIFSISDWKYYGGEWYILFSIPNPQLLLFLFYLNGEPKGLSIGGLLVITKSLSLRYAKNWMIPHLLLLMLRNPETFNNYFISLSALLTRNFGLS